MSYVNHEAIRAMTYEELIEELQADSMPFEVYEALKAEAHRREDLKREAEEE